MSQEYMKPSRNRRTTSPSCATTQASYPTISLHGVTDQKTSTWMSNGFDSKTELQVNSLIWVILCSELVQMKVFKDARATCQSVHW